jgi:hypothetical protein
MRINGFRQECARGNSERLNGEENGHEYGPNDEKR